MQKVKVNGYLFQTLEWKRGRIDRQTDGQTDGADCITYVTNVVDNNHTLSRWYYD